MKKWNAGRLLLAAAACVAILGSLLYYLLDGSDKTFSWIGLVFALAGAVSSLAAFTSFPLAAYFPTALYAASFGFVLRVAIPSLSDVWNKVNFIGGNALLGMIFTGVYLVCTILSICACFIGTTSQK